MSYWDSIPSIEGISVDWSYEPENPLGKRSAVRLVKKDLARMLERDLIKVKILAKNVRSEGPLLDLSVNGVALLLEFEIKVESLVSVSFILGKHRVYAKGIVRNNSKIMDSYRIGIEFVKLDNEVASFINSLNVTAFYRA